MKLKDEFKISVPLHRKLLGAANWFLGHHHDEQYWQIVAMKSPELKDRVKDEIRSKSYDRYGVRFMSSVAIGVSGGFGTILGVMWLVTMTGPFIILPGVAGLFGGIHYIAGEGVNFTALRLKRLDKSVNRRLEKQRCKALVLIKEPS